MKFVVFSLQLLLAAQVVSGLFFIFKRRPRPRPKPQQICRFVGFIFRRKVCTPIVTSINPSRGVCVCTGSGDPHYKTFDGATIHFMGICKYTLAQLMDKTNKCYFNVEVKNEHRGSNRKVAYTRLVDVKINSFTIRLHQGRRVFVNNIEKFLPVTVTTDVTVARAGNNVMVTTACGIKVTFDGRSVVVVRVPKAIGAGKMNGICGSCNGNSGDDFKTLAGVNVRNNRNKYNLVGNSYNVPDDSDKPSTHCMEIPPFPVCSETLMRFFAEIPKYCGQLQSTASPFKQCIDSNRVAVAGYLKSCTLDLCANYKSDIEIVTICKAHAAMAQDCADNGILVNWRKSDFCPMECGANEVYQFDASPCEATCVKPTVGTCNLPKQEGCVCKPGTVRSGNECVHKSDCGCRDTNGDYYPMSSEKRTANCGEMFKCVFGWGKSFLKKLESGVTCHKDATCGVVNGEHMCVCKKGFTGDGVSTCVDLTSRCRCGGSGDPHYLLYDGQKIDFMGICMYTLSQLTERQNPCWFSVEVKNEQRGWNRVVSWTRMVDFAIYGQKVRILSGRRLQINGKSQYLPFTTKDGKMRVFYNGQFVQVDTNCGITVLFNGYSQVTVQVPTHLGNMLNGICGNCNGVKDDYRTKDGEDVTNDRNRYNLIGLSYSVTDDSDAITKGCTPPIAPPDECTAQMQQTIGGNTFCGMIKDTAGPFRECIDAAVVDVEQYFENCKVDVCAYNSKPGFTMKELVCDSLTAFADVCNGFGFELFWRTKETCPLSCGPNEEYSTAVNPCRRTCSGQMTGALCAAPKVEGCQCKQGFVLSDNLCVRKTECGCKDAKGSYYPIGAEFRATDCSAVFKCETKNNKPTLTRYPLGQGCHKDATCAWKNGERSCVCKEGYAGDGVYSCIDTKPCRCSVNGDPHYVTYDGQVIHFQGTCKYTLTQSTTKNDTCAFNVEVKNENRYRNYAVSWTRMVDFEIYGIRVRLLPANKVEIDGEEKFLPFTYGNGKLRVSLVAGKVQVDTDCGISVMFDGKQGVTVDVPNSYSNQMTGICGDCDGKKDDYKTKEGDDLTKYEEHERGKDIGNSYIVDDDSDVPTEKCAIEKPPTGCTDESYKSYADVDFCGYIIDVAGPFRECIDSGLVAFQEMFESCRVDLCSYEATGELKPKEIACEALTSFATACNAAGFVIMWREKDFCPMACPAGQVYSNRVKACPPTCGDSAPNKFCNKPPTEGCQCPEGYLLNDKKCTMKNKCGCTDEEGNYLPIGEKRISDDCSKTYTCTWANKNGRSFVKTEKNGRLCCANAKCIADNGYKKCVCNEGYEGDGFKCNLITTTVPTTPMECGANEVYQFDASPCEATCVKPTVGTCNLPKQEGCVCKPGTVRSGNECVQKSDCGCRDTNGDYYPMSSEKRTANCGEMFKCVFGGGKSFLKKLESGVTCHKDATCGVVNGEHMCVCKKGFTGDGVSTCVDLTSRCRCGGSGDPHYLLYDGQKIDFMGICMYTLSQLTERQNPCWFSVEVKNEQRGWNRVVSWTRMVDFAIYGQKVRILSGRRVQINGKSQYLPFTTKDGKMRVFYNGQFVQVDTNCGITVLFNGYSQVTVQVPTHLGNMLNGICGNCNGVKDDYRTKDGEDVTNDRNRYNLIGLSYSVTDDSDAITKGCTPPIAPPDECTAQMQQTIGGNTFCGMIKDTSGPFRECIDAAVVDVEQYFENCKVDVCAYNGKPGFTMKELVCDSLTAFADVCNGFGFELFWRTKETCPLSCGPNEEYSTAVNPCRRTCSGQMTGALCAAPKVEGCQCKQGFVLSDNLCVRKTECGCKDAKGSYYPIGAEFRAIDCSAVFKCETKNNKPTLTRYPLGQGCHKDATCAWKNGERSCVCKEGYAGDGVYSCIDTKPCRCSVNGDPHYVTYDGQVIHFQGTCKYTLTQSTTKNDTCAFNVEVKNENRYRNYAVSWTRMVDFEIYGIRVRLLPANKVEIDGEEKFLPFTYGNGKLRVSLVAGKVQVDTDCGISVMFDGKQGVTVDVPNSYSNQMTGICGDCDGNKDDYKTKEGDDLTKYEEHERGKDIGNSYIVDDDSDVPSEKCAIEKPPTGCTDESYKSYADVDFCGYIIDVAGPFRECIDSGLVAFQEMFESCRVDLCSYEATGELKLKEIACEALTSFATACNAAGFVIMWREKDFCPMACPAGQVYSNRVKACPPTCGESAPNKFCDKPPTEGCQCPEGYLLNDKKCTMKNKCGCTDEEGNYLPIGEKRISDDCSKTYTCTWANKNGRSFVKTEKNGRLCCANAKCTADNGYKKCVCNEGYEGDGFKCNLITTTVPTTPMECGANEVYQFDASPCEATCVKPTVGTCNLPKQEGCVCKPGTVRSGNECVQKSDCGCRDTNGDYYPMSSEKRTANCGEMFKCVFGGGKSFLKKLESGVTCHKDATCGVVNGEHMCVCKKGFTGDGVSTCVDLTSRCRCGGSGDPHYLLYDGQKIDFMGICMYTLSQLTERQNPCWFSVEVKNEQRGWNRVVSWTRMVDFAIYGQKVRILSGRRVQINGKSQYLPFTTKDGKMRVFYNGQFVQVDTNCGITVLFNGYSQVTVQVPTHLGNMLNGICGNCNGVKDDYRTKDGEDVTNDRNRYNLIGLSYSVTDDSDAITKGCTPPIAPPDECTAQMQQTIGGNTFCGMIKDTAGPFRECIDAAVVDVEQYFENCKVDVCAYHGKPGFTMKELVCDSLTAFADVCNGFGFELFWRTKETCPLSCGPNEEYSTAVNPCRRTCSGQMTGALCAAPKVEGCQCKQGFVLSDNLCVRKTECGCKDAKRSYYPIGAEFRATDCSAVFKCETKNNKPTLTRYPLGQGCHKDATCAWKNGERSCVCKEGYAGDGVYSCIDTKPCRCSVNGDPHYVTYDGQVIHFQGTCKYTLTQSTTKNDTCAFNVEVKNENRYRNYAVSWTRMVDFEIYGIRVRLLPANKVEIDGEEKFLPFTYGNGKLRVSLVAGKVQVDTDCGISVMFDGKQGVTVDVPNSYSNQMTGICGDCDGKKDDYKTKEGDDLTKYEEHERGKDIGNSYIVDDDSDVPTEKCAIEKPPTGCTDESYKSYADVDFCGYIIDVAGPFRECIDSGLVAFQEMFESCRVDLCSYEATGELKLKEIACEALTSFATACNAAGFVIMWREKDFCPMACPAGQVYSNRVKACPPTCGESAPNKFCDKPPTEGCQCPEGYLLNDKKCTMKNKCGCTDEEGNYLPIGEKRISDDCSKTYTCTWANKNGRSFVKTEKNGRLCCANAKCTADNGYKKCVCNEGYEGDGFKCNLITTTVPTTPMECGANEVYQFDASPCEATCVKPTVGTCNLPKQEGCVCKPGTVRSGNECVQKSDCGCRDTNGDYYPMSSEKRTANCGEMFKCVFGGGKSFLKKLESGVTCHKDATCGVVNGEHMCVCKKGFTGDGVSTCVDLTSRCRCGGSGDPHYLLYDGQKIDFMGICMYTLSQLTERQNPCWFSVEVKNEQRGWNRVVSWTRMVDFAIYGQKVRILSGRRVQINGKSQYLPFTTKDGKMRVFYNGQFVQVDTNCGITVLFNGYSQVTVQVPTHLGNMLNGICGNCNGVKDDYRTKDGEDVTNDRNRYNLIGLSYSVTDDSDAITKGCTPPIAPPDECTAQMQQTIGGNTFCGMIKDTAGPFRECIDAAVVDVEQYFENCKVDVCAYHGKPGFTMKELVCDSLTAFADVCNGFGFELFWRTKETCPLSCGPNEEYSTAVNPCRRTCSGQMTGALCAAPKVEGCQCKQGFVLSDNLCVRKTECGCKDAKRSYYPIGAEFRATDCSAVFKCETKNNKPTLTRYPLGQGCHKDATCAWKNGERSCVCKEGYAGDGVYSCIDTKPCRCSVNGDPHYVTYDGQVIHFQGTCKYTLTQSTTKNDTCAFNVEVKNENRYRNYAVSWTRMVDFEIYGIRVRLLPANKVEIDGEEKFLPFTYGNGKLRVSLVAGKVQVDTDCGISVMFDGKQGVTVDVPNSYSNQMTGICGDCDGKKDDYKTKEGDDLTKYEEHERGKDIGNSYIVDDDSDVPTEKCAIEKPPTGCTDESYKSYADVDFCGYIIDVAGPFRECIDSGLVAFQEMFESCRVDLCSYEATGELKLKEIACEALTSFATACNAAGFVIMWREKDFCPMACPAGQVYSNRVKACPPTCGESAPNKFCDKPPTEGCQCPEGYLLNDKKCTMKNKCGCTDEEGNYLPIGEKRISDDCSKTYTCTWANKNGRSFVKTEKNGRLCCANAKCTADNGYKKCVCNEGYEGDGFKCNLITTTVPTTPMECGANEVYQFDASPCEATCVKPTVGTCNLPKQEGCVCKPGTVRSGNECVQKSDCGCRDTNGDYYPMSSEKRTANCGEMFKCVFGGGKSFLKKLESGVTCHKDATCGVVNGEHMCVCKKGFTGDGVSTCVDLTSRCRCGGSGDPHYLLYDGQKIDFMGICMYTLSQLTERQNPCWFSVEVKNEQRGWNRVVSWTRMVDFAIYGQKVRILSGRRVQINGKSQYLPFTTKDGKMRVFYNGQFVQVDTNCGITVLFNGYSQVTVQVPTHLGNMLNGICGNCNGVKDDYRTKDGEDVTNDRNRYNLIGLSYSVTDDSDAITKGCTPPIAPPDECTAQMQQTIGGNTFCGMIKDTAGPFRECIDAAVVDVEQYFENCKVDVCAYNGKPGFTMKELVCDSLTAFADVCNGFGFELFWRTKETCPLSCGPNEEYSTAVNPCRRTCSGQMTGALCAAPKVEGCQCKQGFVLSDNLCVRKTECGCKDAKRSYYPIGAEFRATDCSAVFKCETKNNKPTLTRYPLGQGCHKDATCAWKNGERSCVCKEGYAGDGVYSCIDTKPCRCSVNGDPHYVTYDGQVIHFQGTCKYTLTQSTTKNGTCAFNVEVKNENRYRNYAVSWTRMVDFEIYGIRVRLLPANKVEIDGEEKFLPFTYGNGKLRVSLVAGKVQVDTDCGISVMFDGKQGVTVDVPNSYSNHMTGICGDCDGKKDDYKTKEGDDLTNYEEHERGKDIGNSYIVDDDSDVSSEECAIEKPPTGCTDESYKSYADVDFCGYIIDVAGPFRECIDSGLVAFQEMFESCRVDLCSYEATGELKPKEIACEALTSFATACNAAGFVIMWREKDFCPMACPAGQVYSNRVKACPPTCGESAPNKFCDKPPTEGCQCPEGYLLNDKKCTMKIKCGCTDEEGNYLPIGEKRISDDCSKTYTCTWANKNGRSFVKTEKNGRLCCANAKCTADNGYKKCVCNEGYEGDGFKCNLITTTVPTTPKVTTTVAPCELIAEIGVIMDSSSSIGPKNYEIMKGFVQDVVTNFDVRPDKVRVALETYNRRAKIQFNFDTHGYEADIHFAIEKIQEINIGTYTHLALKKARTKMFRIARKGIPKIAIVLTDGLSRKPKRTRIEAKRLRDSGVTVFCIGIGKAWPKEVNAIASDPDSEHSFMVDSFQALDSIKEAIKAATCEASETRLK